MNPLLERAVAAFDSHQYEDAIPLLEELAREQIPEALSMLGSAYHVGLGVEANGPEAVRLLSMAAEQGFGLAAHNLGTLYITGMPGIPSDHDLGRHWYCRAKELGCNLWR